MSVLTVKEEPADLPEPPGTAHEVKQEVDISPPGLRPAGTTPYTFCEVKTEVSYCVVPVSFENDERVAPALTNNRATRRLSDSDLETRANTHTGLQLPGEDIAPAATDRITKMMCSATNSTTTGEDANKQTINGKQKYVCDTCGNGFIRKNNLISHLRSHILKSLRSVSKEKGKKIKDKDNLGRTNTIQIQMDAPCGYKCSLCNNIFSFPSALKTHIRLHTGVKPFECSVCNKKFNASSTLTGHMRLHTGEKPYECIVCNSKFSLKSNLNKHLRLHTGEKPFECRVCNKKFNQNVNLVRHMRLHTCDKPCECAVCYKKFSSTSSLTRHMKQHTSEKKYECSVCGLKFIQQRHLIAHMRVHVGDVLFECSACNKKFKQRCSLTRHARIHTR